MERKIYCAYFLLFFFYKLLGFCGSLKNKEKEKTVLYLSTNYKYSKFIKKVNVPNNHGSGVYVDQSLEIGSTKHANGKCPVYNKFMVTPGNTYLNYMIKGEDMGFQYPDKNITPTTQETLHDCAEVIRQTLIKVKGILQPFTGLYNMKDKQCYIISGSYQFVTASKLSVYPIKNINDFVFLTNNIHHDYEDKCPEKCNDNTEFGKLENGQCLNLSSTKSTISKSATDCAIFLFDNSPHDGVINATEKNIIFDRGIQLITNGIGYNWANYYKEKQTCVLYNEAPSCINFKKNVKAFVSTAKVNGDDCEPFPETTTDKCLVKDSIQCGEGTQNIYTCDEGLCHKTEKKCSVLCDTNTENTGFNIWYVVGPLIGILVLAILAVLIYCLTRKKKSKKKSIDKQTIVFQKGKEKKALTADYLEQPEESFWEELHNETRVIMDKDY